MPIFRLSFLALAALLAIAQASAKDALPDPVGRIVGVHDGDSITLLTEGQEQVTIKNHGLDRYKRTLGRVFCGGLDVNLEMVRLGMGWRFDKYSKEGALIEAQKEAQAARRGLWLDKEPVPPWEWRKKKTEKTE